MCIYLYIYICMYMYLIYICNIYEYIRWVYKYQYVSNLVELTQTGKHGVKQEIFNNIEHDVYNPKHDLKKQNKKNNICSTQNSLMKQYDHQLNLFHEILLLNTSFTFKRQREVSNCLFRDATFHAAFNSTVSPWKPDMDSIKHGEKNTGKGDSTLQTKKWFQWRVQDQ